MTEGADAARLPDAALLIDWENLKFSLLNRQIRPNVSAIRDVAEAHGRVVVARAYADWQDGYHASDPANLYAAGIEPIYVPTRSYYESDSTEKRKNSVDVKLTADCIELCHNYASIGVYLLVTGDQDFLHLVNTLRPYGKKVIIIGVSWTTSGRLAERVDDVIYYDRDVDPAARPPEVEAPAPGMDLAAVRRSQQVSAAAQEIRRTVSIPEDLVDQLEGILETIVEVVSDFRGRGQQLALSDLGMELGKRVNAQLFSLLVKGRLKQITTALQVQGLILVRTRNFADWLYLPDETEEGPESEDQRPQYDNPFGAAHFVDLPLAERREVLEALRRFREQPGVRFLTFNKACDVLSGTAPGRRLGGETRRLVQGMLDSGVLVKDQQQTDYDPSTGNAFSFWSFRVDYDHERVRDCSD